MRNSRATMLLSEMIARTGDKAEVIETAVFVRSDFSVHQKAEQTIFCPPGMEEAQSRRMESACGLSLLQGATVMLNSPSRNSDRSSFILVDVCAWVAMY